jgi:hypothetical protein
MKEKQQKPNYFYNKLVRKDQLKNILGNVFPKYGLVKFTKVLNTVRNLQQQAGAFLSKPLHDIKPFVLHSKHYYALKAMSIFIAFIVLSCITGAIILSKKPVVMVAIFTGTETKNEFEDHLKKLPSQIKESNLDDMQGYLEEEKHEGDANDDEELCDEYEENYYKECQERYDKEYQERHAKEHQEQHAKEYQEQYDKEYQEQYDKEYQEQYDKEYQEQYDKEYQEQCDKEYQEQCASLVNEETDDESIAFDHLVSNAA